MTASVEPAGYLDPRFFASHAEWGEIRPLPRSGSWLLVRPIPGTHERDALLGYPRLLTADVDAVTRDLDALAADLVSVVTVTGALLDVRPEDLGRAFPALVRPYKEHTVIDLADVRVSAHHRAKVRRALRAVEVRRLVDPAAELETWERLYDRLRQRHGLVGLKALSRAAFRDQLAVQGCLVFGAFLDGACVAMMLWYLMGEHASYHLGASSDAGYAAGASYALVDAAIGELAGRGVRLADLGANAGADARDDGLARFKRGWSDLTRPTWLCARTMRPDAYVLLSRDAGTTSFMPAYRARDEA